MRRPSRTAIIVSVRVGQSQLKKNSENAIVYNVRFSRQWHWTKTIPSPRPQRPWTGAGPRLDRQGRGLVRAPSSSTLSSTAEAASWSTPVAAADDGLATPSAAVDTTSSRSRLRPRLLEDEGLCGRRVAPSAAADPARLPPAAPRPQPQPRKQFARGHAAPTAHRRWWVSVGPRSRAQPLKWI